MHPLQLASNFRELCARIAGELGLDPSYVGPAALGERKSNAVQAGLN
jgi:hypothetical protein